MILNEETLNKMAEWSENYDPKNMPRIDKEIAHKTNEQNVFLSRVARLQGGDTETFLSQLIVDDKHPYFFEHEYDHIPGMAIIEAGRQVGVGIAHLFYDVALGKAFILNEINIRFFKYVELKKPLFTVSQVSNIVYRKDELLKMDHVGHFFQDKEEKATMSGKWQMYDKRIVERLRSSSKSICKEE